jgi:hypothetical protein
MISYAIYVTIYNLTPLTFSIKIKNKNLLCGKISIFSRQFSFVYIIHFQELNFSVWSTLRRWFDTVGRACLALWRSHLTKFERKKKKQ